MNEPTFYEIRSPSGQVFIISLCESQNDERYKEKSFFEMLLQYASGVKRRLRKTPQPQGAETF
jgi:hypothetical protein